MQTLFNVNLKYILVDISEKCDKIVLVIYMKSNLKNRVLEFLQNNSSVSGEEMAQSLGVSRAAVWKAVNVLRSEGFEIEAVNNKGYILKSACYSGTTLSQTGIYAYLNSSARQIFDIEYEKSVTSTNTVLKLRAAKGEKTGKTLIASHQTSGRGRLGREFVSPDNGIYMSVIIRPRVAIEKSLLITTATAVCVSRAVKKVTNGKEPLIKWVNDLFLNGRKICGILTEASIDFESRTLDYAVIGIGINLLPPCDSGELAKIAGGIFESEKDIPSNFANLLCAGILNELSVLFDDSSITSESYLNEYRRLSFLIGKEVAVVKGESRRNARALAIDDNAAIIVEYEDGTTQTLMSNEVSLRGDFYEKN